MNDRDARVAYKYVSGGFKFSTPSESNSQKSNNPQALLLKAQSKELLQ